MAAETATDREGSKRGRLGSRGQAGLAGLWLLAALLSARQLAAVLRLPQEDRLTDLFAWIDNGALTASSSLYEGEAPFTGTPFAGLVLRPLARAAEQGLGVAWTVGTMALVAALGVVAARALPGPLPRRTAHFAVPLALILLAVSVPVRNTFHLGQTSVLPVLLALVGWLLQSRGGAGGVRGFGGVLLGLAAALQPAVLLFVPVLWLTGRGRAALCAAGTFLGGTALAWAVLPAASWTYWVRHLAGTGLGDPADATGNQSLHGALLRAGLSGPVEIVLFACLALAVAVLAVRRAVRYARDGQPLLAAALVGCAAVAVSPTAWQHQQLWVLLAVAGRVGRRKGDRLVWPVLVVLVMSLDGGVLMPGTPGLHLLGENLPLLAAVAAACAVPFLSRGSEYWARPEPSGPLSRPNVMLELLLIRVGYWAYSYVRSLAPDERSTAEAHGEQILGLESLLRIDVEHWLNRLTARTGWLEAFCNFYYSTFHFVVPIALLAWLYLRRPAGYRTSRTALCIATLLGLVGFWLYPLAPPRLMPGLGYIDTAHGPQDLSDPDFGALTQLSNQYAAMPSLHVGWSLWCAVVVWRAAPWLWLRLLGALYPTVTLFVVMATANHYLLDAVGGAVVVAAGFLVALCVVPALKRRWGGSAAGDPDAPAPTDAERSGPPGNPPCPQDDREPVRETADRS